MKEKVVIDAESGIMGRIASYAAKSALAGKEIAIINCEKAVISGNKEYIIKNIKKLRGLNSMKPRKGPFFSRSPEKIFKRSIRGMLPDYRVGRGREAWKRIRCYNKIPEDLKKEKVIKIKIKAPDINIRLEELS